MAFSDLTKRLAKKAMVITDSFMTDVTIVKHTVTGYDVVTDAPTETVLPVTLRGLLYEVDDHERRNDRTKDPRPEGPRLDKKLLISAVDLPVGFEPTINDACIIGTEDWEIWRVTTAPSNPIWTVYISRMG